LLQAPLFHQIHQHFVRSRVGQRMMLLFVVTLVQDSVFAEYALLILKGIPILSRR
jgi:hypothetical protein